MKDTEDCIPMELSSSGKLRLRFACSNDIDFYLEAISQSNMKGEIFTKVITKSIDDEL